MKLDYISNINRYGDDILRLYEFDKLFMKSRIDFYFLAHRQKLAE